MKKLQKKMQKVLLKKYKQVVIKTLFNKGGDGVEKVDIKNPYEANNEFMKLINIYQVPVVVQKFIENVKNGDKRIILLDGKIKLVVLDDVHQNIHLYPIHCGYKMQVDSNVFQNNHDKYVLQEFFYLMIYP